MIRKQEIKGNQYQFDIVAGVLWGDILAPYMFIICLNYILQTSIDLIKENGSTLKETSSRWYPTKTMTDTDYTMI